jgi:hypothetical protein
MSYVTKDEVKKYMGVNFSAGLDSFVDTVIAGCQLYIEKFCGDPKLGKRVFEAPSPDDPVTRVFNGNGSEKLFIGDLFDVVSVEVDGVALTESDDYYLYPLNQTDEAYQYIEMVQPFTRVNSNSRIGTQGQYIFEIGQSNVVIEGHWYFTETCPADIKLALLKLVGAVIKENVNDGDVKEKKSEQLGDYNVSYQEVSKIAHSLGVNDILAPYTRSASVKALGFGGSSGVIAVS